jgi:transketolase
MIRSFRNALNDTIEELAAKDNKLVVLNADSSRALRLSPFQEKYPGRMFSFGISEADMLTTAAGMATTGLLPMVVGFAMFVAEKPFEQIRQAIAYPNLNVKIVATHSGLCVGKDGATHQALEDVAILRTLPNMKIFVAADVAQAQKMLQEMCFVDGPAYLRLGRDMAEDVYTDDCKVHVGGADLLRKGDRATIVADGLMVEKALKAAEELSQKDISVSVINAYCLKPLDKNLIVEEARKTGVVVTVEDHSVIGGLGSAVAELLANKNPVLISFIGVKDCFGESGSQEALYEKYGLTVDHIVTEVLSLVNSQARGEGR